MTVVLRSKWPVLLTLSFAVLLAMGLWFSVTAVVPSLQSAWSLSNGQAAWLTMAVQIGFVVGTLALALLNLADLWPARFVCAGGASHIFKPHSVGEGMGRTWYAPWSSASAYALPIQVGAKMTQMENRIVLTRFKDGYGPVGAYFLHLKTYTENAYGDNYEATWYDSIKELVGDYVDHQPVQIGRASCRERV